VIDRSLRGYIPETLYSGIVRQLVAVYRQPMIVVTGGAGFIGSNLVHALVRQGADVLVIDDLSTGSLENLRGLGIRDVVTGGRFREMLTRGDARLDSSESVVHLGARTSTRETNRAEVMDVNLDWSREILRFCLDRRLPLTYASSAAVYAGVPGHMCREIAADENPRSLYAESKWKFDELVRCSVSSAPVVGLRFFNVYGPREVHKGSMASVVLQFARQLAAQQPVKLFCGSDGFGDGEHRRDFVHVDDVVATILWFMSHRKTSGIFNVGTGVAATFNVIAAHVLKFYGATAKAFVPMPSDVASQYQSSTQADLTRLRGTGCDVEFRPAHVGIFQYLNALEAAKNAPDA
jgi:ADP-L-glycero-D-manno-heptose 6-epimerase